MDFEKVFEEDLKTVKHFDSILDSIIEIGEYVKQHYHKDYTLSIFNSIENNTCEVICNPEEIQSIVAKISSLEHSFPEWIGCNSLTKSYVIGMPFTRGRVRTPSVLTCEQGELIKH